jgi:hypothetical protein
MSATTSSHGTDHDVLTYLWTFLTDWLTGMCGVLSVPFAGIAVWAQTPTAKVLWGCLAVLAFFVAGYRVWRNERRSRTLETKNLRQDKDREIQELRAQVAALGRKPYNEELGRQGAELIASLSPEGRTLLRHLVVNEPLVTTTRFKNEITQDVQDAQLRIAYGMGVVRHSEVRAGGHLLRTEYVVNPQFRPVLQDLLYQ